MNLFKTRNHANFQSNIISLSRWQWYRSNPKEFYTVSRYFEKKKDHTAREWVTEFSAD